MAFSAGTFSLYTPGNPVVTGTTIASTWANNTLNDIATGLSTCVLKDGTQTITANLPMGGFKLTGLGAGSATGNSLRYEQLFTAGNVTALGTFTFPTTVGVGAATPSASGSGISFPATQSGSSDVNTLDDYEEGSWTPAVGGSATYTIQIGTYTKIGNVVFVDGQIQINAIGSGSTTVISGLPFTSAAGNTTNGIQVHFISGGASNMVYISGIIVGSGTTITLESLIAAGGTMAANAFFQNSAQIVFSGRYHV